MELRNPKGRRRHTAGGVTRPKIEPSRPLLVVDDSREIHRCSDDVINERPGTDIAAVPTSRPQRAGYPPNLELTAKRTPKRSWVKISQVRTLAVERIGSRIAAATPEQIDQVVEGLNEIIGG